MKPIYFTLLLTVSLLVGCKNNTNLSEAQRAAIISDVNRVMSNTADSIRAKGIIGWVPFFYKSPDFAWVSGKMSSSYDETVLLAERLTPQYRTVTFKWDSIRVQALTENEASVVANWLDTRVDTTGKSTQFNATFKCKLSKVGESWKFNRIEQLPNQ